MVAPLRKVRAVFRKAMTSDRRETILRGARILEKEGKVHAAKAVEDHAERIRSAEAALRADLYAKAEAFVRDHQADDDRDAAEALLALLLEVRTSHDVSVQRIGGLKGDPMRAARLMVNGYGVATWGPLARDASVTAEQYASECARVLRLALSAKEPQGGPRQ